MHAGILIIGSLFWDTKKRNRISWRESNLEMNRAILVKAPIYYGRKSSSRGNTFTMTFFCSPTESEEGSAILVPCKTPINDTDSLLKEAHSLWRAESPHSKPGSINASWGTVGILFSEQVPDNIRIEWSNQRHETVSPVINGELNIPRPAKKSDGLDISMDFILATATKSEEKIPKAVEIAKAWIENGYEDYFFNNVKHGIRTYEDIRIWNKIKESNPDWLQKKEYSEAIEILSRDSKII
ncbi:hypothetical protein COW64_21615 [bacterium (Candidatus Blackallbacteria) CG18_big_fil_WC_8_21_14_2_50_49_26]|nr:MAG: hypothetical protein COW64_21615 [bacterium (Candidatus Blackallbacteria) CG18_big_fil_WC_8_21_14_2_50_49_26]